MNAALTSVRDTAYDRVVTALEQHGSTVVPAKGSGLRSSAQCPAHADRSPSLSVTGIEGQVLVHCHGGCEIDDVLAALQLSKADLFDTRRGADYRYDGGRVVHRRPDKSFRQSNTGARPELYRLAAVRKAVAEGRPVYIAEGEKDVHALESLGVTATCSPMGAGKWGKVDPTPLHGGHILVVADQDDAGRAHADDVMASLTGAAADLTLLAPKTGKDAADHIAAGHGVADFVRADPTEGVAARLPRLDWHALWADNEPDEFILEPVLPARRLVTIYSRPKLGKSLLMLEIAVAISRGTQVLGAMPDRAHNVLYVDFENDPRGDIRKRLEAMGYGPDDLERLCYLSFPTLAGLDSTAGGEELMLAIAHYQCDVVVIDTVSRAVDGDENENDTWLAFYRHTGLRLKQAGVALVRLDHSGKDETKGMRGGSAKYGDVDVVWKLTGITADTFRLEVEAARLPITENNLTLTRVTEPTLHHVVAAHAAGAAFDAALADTMTKLDELEVPAAAGRDTAREALKAAGYSVGNGVLSEVIRRRKAVRGLSGQPVQPELSTDSADSVRTGQQ